MMASAWTHKIVEEFLKMVLILKGSGLTADDLKHTIDKVYEKTTVSK